jgi:hypothetical protein
MPELVACPTCGCKVQMPEGILGRRVRCFGCGNSFVAAPSPPAPERKPPPPKPVPPRRAADEDEEEAVPLPFCPSCGRPVRWKARRCSHCGEEFEDESAYGRPARRREPPPPQFDGLPHRGELITNLGNISLVVGCLSMCLFGLGAVVSVPLGVAAWVLAQNDLAQMRAGRMDPAGKTLTENGRGAAITGIALSLAIVAAYVLFFLIGR